MNLLTNAIKFTFSGSVTVRAEIVYKRENLHSQLISSLSNDGNQGLERVP
jgi:signal transduction histidine kinase